ncbi:MAG: hypothetical protein IKA96_04900 [Alistipes sp.]|nr:hypothetical protein [Alistipes sp.]MBR7097084.1 hypothetical protein [Alistipes sp.]
MELEQLKQSWEKLSERLEREEVMRKQELRSIAENKTKSYWHKIKVNQYLSWLVLAGSIGILFARGIQNDPFGWIVIGAVIAMDLIFFSPMWKIIKKLAKFDATIVEQELMIIRFEKLFIRNNIITACFLTLVFAYVMIEVVARNYARPTEWWLWVILTIIASAVFGGWRYLQEKERIAEIKQRILALKQFEE